MSKPKNLFKTTIVIWSDYDPSQEGDIDELAHDATYGDSYCSKESSVVVEDPEKDPDWDGTEFFGVDDGD
jgi:hypothetical protein